MKDKAADMRKRDKAYSSPEPEKGLTKRGQIKLKHAASIPGQNWESGTPGYIKSAAEHAEKASRKMISNFGGGIPKPARHRVEDGWSGGKPDVKKDADYCNTEKETK
jgi:hypothetical protein